MAKKIQINRAPVLTLWAAVVAERQGYDREAALTLGQSLAGLNAQSKGRRLGIYAPKEAAGKPEGKKETAPPKTDSVALLGREVPVVHTPQGLRAAVDGKAVEPAAVRTYLEKKFGPDLDDARAAMEHLAKALTPAQLKLEGFGLYEKFRPQIPEGKKGWGARGVLDLDKVRSLAR
jgi:hypothetical protein